MLSMRLWIKCSSYYLHFITYTKYKVRVINFLKNRTVRKSTNQLANIRGIKVIRLKLYKFRLPLLE